MKLKSLVFTTVFCLANVTVSAQQPSTNDLWDISQGVTILRNSAVDNYGRNPATPYDIRNILGYHFVYYPGEAYNVLFSDSTPSGFTHFLEWRTPTPVTVRSFNLWAAGDSSGREMASFRLLAKSSGATNFDLVVYTFTPSHPYQYIDGVFGLLIATDITPTTAQEFRAEFENPTPMGYAPRVREIDGFSEFLGPRTTIRVSEVEVSWKSVEGVHYQTEYRTDLPSSNWNHFGSLMLGDGGTLKVTDSLLPGEARRFYRVRPMDAPTFQRDYDFDALPIGSAPLDAIIAVAHQGDSVLVTDDCSVSGTHSLKVTDAPGMQYFDQPYFNYLINQTNGEARCSFDIRIDDETDMYHEWRDNDVEKAGPSFEISRGVLKANFRSNGPTCQVPINEWFHLEVIAGLGAACDGTWKLRISASGRPTQEFSDLPNVSSDFRNFKWLAFSSTAVTNTSFYLDNIKAIVMPR